MAPIHKKNTIEKRIDIPEVDRAEALCESIRVRGFAVGSRTTGVARTGAAASLRRKASFRIRIAANSVISPEP
ncbi:hypothetical protein GCM10011572_40730 [Pseudoduganella buxea]|uniref:Uncharacterized protein n=1 Tax=Pseudoduganella buxea TaxID=1949069 RepID=A0ABQ1L0C0_9BURK|nr:hypothetical protein GCM10011572_40730 [Pseudoduganella buxea]